MMMCLQHLDSITAAVAAARSAAPCQYRNNAFKQSIRKVAEGEETGRRKWNSLGSSRSSSRSSLLPPSFWAWLSRKRRRRRGFFFLSLSFSVLFFTRAKEKKKERERERKPAVLDFPLINNRNNFFFPFLFSFLSVFLSLSSFMFVM